MKNPFAWRHRQGRQPLSRPAKRSSLLLLLALLAACTTPDPRCAALPGGGRYCLQTNQAVAAFEVEQKIEATFRGRRETLIASIALDGERLDLVGLTPFGHKLLHLVWDNQAASAPTLPDQRLDPALPLALLQLALWPADVVRAGLGAGLNLDQAPGQRRILLARDSEPTVIIHIHYLGQPPSDQALRITLPAAQLELNVQTLAPEAAQTP